MTKIYTQFMRAHSARVRVYVFSHILSNHVITVIFYTPVDEKIIDSETVPPGNQNQ